MITNPKVIIVINRILLSLFVSMGACAAMVILRHAKLDSDLLVVFLEWLGTNLVIGFLMDFVRLRQAKQAKPQVCKTANSGRNIG